MATLYDLCKQHQKLQVDADDLAKYGDLCAWVDSYTGMIGIYFNKVSMKLHRLVMNAPADYQVDHVDRDRMNNTKSNLRLATCSEQQFNTKLRTDNTTGVRGVDFHKPSGLWRARLTRNKKEYVTFHSTLELAVAGRKQLEAKHLKGVFKNETNPS